MHLHARRLVISQPGGGKLDVTAELPEHFAATMEQLGFDTGLSDAAPISVGPPERTGIEKKQAARKHAKQYRKSQRAPRRARGDAKKASTPARGKPAAKGKTGRSKSAPKGVAPKGRKR